MCKTGIGMTVLLSVALVVLSHPTQVESQTAKNGAPVTVVNTPLPVSGNVGITGTPTVNIGTMPAPTNTAASALYVSDMDKARNAFWTSCQLKFESGETSASLQSDQAQSGVGPGCLPTVAVQSNQRAVITSISFTGALPAGQFFWDAQIYNGAFGTAIAVPTLLGTVNNFSFFAAVHPAFLVVPKPGPFYMQVFRSEAIQSESFAHFYVSGYLVDCSVSGSCH